MVKAIRKIVLIDEEKCNGCGVCIPSCVEGALQIIDGKARLVSDKYCDGLGACLGKCPLDAISIVEREAEEFDEQEALAHQKINQNYQNEEVLPCGCPSAQVRSIEKSSLIQSFDCVDAEKQKINSELTHWPVQLALVPPTADFLKGADLLLVADCVPFAYPAIHRDFLKNRAVLVACPKLDDFDSRLAKLTEIISKAGIKSVTVVRMEVPCCGGLTMMAKMAIDDSKNNYIPFEEVVISIDGNIKSKRLVA